MTFPNLPKYSPQAPDPAHTGPSPWSSHTSLDEKPALYSPTTTTSLDPTLDADGFTAEERREHARSLRHMRSIRLVALSRLGIRFLSVIVSGAAFLFIIVTILLFTRYHKSHRGLEDPSEPDERLHVNYSPVTFFASVSGIFTIVSLSLNILCCLMPRLRAITPVSNIVFATVSVIGMAGWLTGCLFLNHGRSGGALGGKENFWYFVCDAALDLDSEAATSTGTGAAADAHQLNRFCNYTSNSWDLGLLQLAFEILTFINVVIAWFMVRSGMLRAARL
jgi:hypothetical protein